MARVALSTTFNSTWLQRMGYMYRLRIQLVLAFWMMALVAIVVAVIVATLVGYQFATLVSVLAVYALALVLRSAAVMILAGDRANQSVDECRTALLQAQARRCCCGMPVAAR